jgi:hypothetical protein
MDSAAHTSGVAPPQWSNSASASGPSRCGSYECFSSLPDDRIVQEVEVEIETAALRRASARRRERFLKGPILMRHIGTANKLSGQALALFLAIRHRIDLTGKPTVTLPRSLLDELGISKDAKSRGLRQLEGAGLVVVDRSKGRAARVALVALARSS